MKPINIIFTLILFSAPVFSSDLDDGISKYTDGSISKDDELGDKIVNRLYIVQKARSVARQAENRDDCYELSGYSNVQNSVVIDAGADTKNLDTIINVQDENGQSNPMGCSK